MTPQSKVTQIGIYDSSRLLMLIEAEASVAWKAAIRQVRAFAGRGHSMRFGRTVNRNFVQSGEFRALPIIASDSPYRVAFMSLLEAGL